MLFTSYTFIYLFFPLTFTGYFIFGRISRRAAVKWLLFASFVFYGSWDVRYLPLLAGSIVFNYFAGASIAATSIHKDRFLFISIAVNLLILCWYKYANFFGENISLLLGGEWESLKVILPIGISFFTFTQIAFLVDVRRGEVREYNFFNYSLFVTYFPHLVAGPVLHHKEMMPQFNLASSYRININDITYGLMIFSIGLFKKVILADGFQYYVSPVFDAPVNAPLSFDEAWVGALTYTFQLYFDFSGYSDMAVGLSRMLGIVLPVNFNSPYKSRNIIEFWRRWHMTLSRFLRDYLYFSLGGNRCGRVRRYLNLMITMLLGGLWHGANWTFLLWGGLHGIYLVVNNGWQALIGRYNANEFGRHAGIFGVLVTFIVVVIGWVVFRSNSFEVAQRVLTSMSPLHGVSLPNEWVIYFHAVYMGIIPNNHHLYPDGLTVYWWIVLGMLIVWAAPNSQEITNKVMGIKGKILIISNQQNQHKRNRNIFSLGVWVTIVVLISAIAGSREFSEFIYFNF